MVGVEGSIGQLEQAATSLNQSSGDLFWGKIFNVAELIDS